MADTVQDSFKELNRFTEVLFQRGRDVGDWELNEEQRIARVFLYRSMLAGVCGGSTDPAFPWPQSGFERQRLQSYGFLHSLGGSECRRGLSLLRRDRAPQSSRPYGNYALNSDVDDSRVYRQ